MQLGKDAVKLAGSAGKALWYGAGDVLGTNDPKAISQEDYYALAWAPWYHAGTVLCLRNGCKGIGDIAGHMWHPCKDYFASHDMTSSTAQDACDNMRDNKFYPRVRAFAKLMPAAAEAYIEVMRPLAKQCAVTDYGSTQVLLANKPAFVQGCVNKLTVEFPFPPPDPGHCEGIRQSLYYNGRCPAGDAQAVLDLRRRREEAAAVADRLGVGVQRRDAEVRRDAQRGGAGAAAESAGIGGRGLPAAASAGTSRMGIKLKCRTYTAYQDCLGVMSGASNPQAHCAYDQQKADKEIVNKIMARSATSAARERHRNRVLAPVEAGEVPDRCARS